MLLAEFIVSETVCTRANFHFSEKVSIRLRRKSLTIVAEITGRQPLKNLKGYGQLKAALHKFYFVHS